MITQALCNSYKREILKGIHQETDNYYIALFGAAASLSQDTTAYSATNEVSGAGYTAGGQLLAGFAAALDGDTAYIDFTTNPSWPTATITARGALIYNASQGNKAVAVLDFGVDVSSVNGTFVVTLPSPAAATALIRIT